MKSPPALAWVSLAAGALVILFWALYFTGSAALGQDDPLRRSFETAFPLADGVLAATLVATGVQLLRRRSNALFFLVIAASMSLYLGLLDTTFYLRHGMYSPLTAGAVSEILINTLCVGGGLVGLRYGWRRWRNR
jgi:hypothetical protein